jgi:CubicO group peptidase (beta-lactamase class C family)
VSTIKTDAIKKLLVILFILGLTQSILAQQTVPQKLDELIDAYVKWDKFNGSALIAEHGKILLEKGYGFKNFQNNTLNDSNTIFQIASITKQFTSTMILKLVELKKMALTDKLSKYYPDFSNGNSITIENLLTHTSGIISDAPDDSSFINSEEQKMTHEERFLASIKNRKLDFSPGTNWEYSNSGYILLGYIIEKVLKMTYFEAVRKYIFAPLNMTHSGFDFEHLRDTEKATGYSTISDSSKIEGSSIDFDSTGPFAAGAIYSTVGDLYKWHEGLQSNKIITKISLDKACTPFKNNYGYGWEIDSFLGKRIVSHSGVITGFNSNIARIPEDDVCIVLLNNMEGSGIGAITKKIFSILYNQPYSVPVKRQEIKLSEETLKKYVGTYEITSPPISAEVTIENGKLVIQASGGQKLELLPYQENHFFIIVQDDEAEIEFGIDESGKIDKIIIYQEGQKMLGKKIK